MLTESQRRQLLGLAILALALFVGLSLIPISFFGEAAPRIFPDGNIMGVLGSAIARAGFGLFGAGILLVPVVLLLAGARLFGWVDRSPAGRWQAVGIEAALATLDRAWDRQFDYHRPDAPADEVRPPRIWRAAA